MSGAKVDASGAEEIWLQADVAVLLGPQSEGDGSEVVDYGDSIAISGQVDRAHADLAGFAGFDANMRKLLGHVDGQLLFVLFAASHTIDSAEVPFLKAE